MITNNHNNVSFGARVKFFYKDWSDSICAPDMYKTMKKLTKVEDMFAKETEGDNYLLNVDLVLGNGNKGFYTRTYVHSKFPQPSKFLDMKDNIFWKENIEPKVLVNKLKDILKYFKKEQDYMDLIAQKDNELNALLSQAIVKYFKKEQGYMDLISQKENELKTLQSQLEKHQNDTYTNFKQNTITDAEN